MEVWLVATYGFSNRFTNYSMMCDDNLLERWLQEGVYPSSWRNKLEREYVRDMAVEFQIV